MDARDHAFLAEIERLRNSPEAKRWKEHRRAMGRRFEGDRKAADTNPSFEDFFLHGRMKSIEYAAGAKAAEEAIRAEREFWLPRLERWLEACGSEPYFRVTLEEEIRRLRRCLGIRQEPLTLDERRARTRERVRKHRARRARRSS